MSQNPRNNGWSIICDASKGGRLGITHMAMVDKVAFPDSDWWTTDDPGSVMHFRNEGTAHRTCARLTERSPRVVRYDVAFDLIRFQQEQTHMAALDIIAKGGTA